MHLIVIAVFFLVLCPLTRLSFADEKSDCLNACTIDKRSNDMYCPPAGGYSDDDHKQCREKNTAAYNQCLKACSPAPVPPPVEAQPAAVEPPAEGEPPAETQSEPPASE